MLANAVREMDGGHFNTAHRLLGDVLTRRPGWDEARYQLGVCEQARRRVQPAWDAFAAVSPDSRWALQR